MPKKRKSEKISVSSGSAADILSDLDISEQATKRAQRYISVASGSLQIKGHPPTVLVLNKDSSSGMVTVVKKAVGKGPTIPKITAKGTATTKKKPKKKTVRKKTQQKKSRSPKKGKKK